MVICSTCALGSGTLPTRISRKVLIFPFYIKIQHNDSSHKSRQIHIVIDISDNSIHIGLA
jgi:hypothetical protein